MTTGVTASAKIDGVDEVCGVSSQMDRLPWGKVAWPVRGDRGLRRGRQRGRRMEGRGWAAVVGRVGIRAEDIIMDDWVGCINKMPR